VSTDAQENDLFLNYLLFADANSWYIGGDLSFIERNQFHTHPEGKTISIGEINCSGYYGDYYRTGSLEEFGASYNRSFHININATGSTPLPWSSVILSGEKHSKYRFKDKHNTQHLIFRDDFWFTSFNIQTELRPVRLYTDLYLSYDQEPGYRIGVGTYLPNTGYASINWQSRKYQPQFDLFWDDGVTSTEIRVNLQGITGYLRTPHLMGLYGEFRIWKNDLVRPGKNYFNCTLEPFGDQSGYHLLFTYETKNGRYVTGTRGQDVKTMAYGMKVGLPFSKITSFEGRIYSYFLSFAKRYSRKDDRLLVEIERMNWELYSRGHVEFWPFTSGLIDLIGMRRYFIVNSSGYLWRLHLGRTGRLSETWNTSFGTNLIGIWPSASIDHWRPAYLIFGKEDVQYIDIRIYRILIGALHLSLNYNKDDWTISYEFTQFFPLKVWERTSIPTEPSPEPKLKRGKEYGGGIHKITLSRLF